MLKISSINIQRKDQIRDLYHIYEFLFDGLKS